MRRALVLVSLIGFAGLASNARACRCSFDYVDGRNDYYSKAFHHSEAIVHARVVAVDAKKQARIVIIESFKGRPQMLQAAGRGMCSVIFKAGDEAIYLVNSEGQVGACSELPADKSVLDNFRAYSRKPQPDAPVERDARWGDGGRRSPRTGPAPVLWP